MFYSRKTYYLIFLMCYVWVIMNIFNEYFFVIELEIANVFKAEIDTNSFFSVI